MAKTTTLTVYERKAMQIPSTYAKLKKETEKKTLFTLNTSKLSVYIDLEFLHYSFKSPDVKLVLFL